ncbi:hypothetical protein BC349_16850 [Flavihumibacter stibioxidans]|uniref:Uncharacterized protein n=1 Tax=Flavihumibacter stibioxidans TaxID=1834163 RepID=A0ABR7MDT1_9BACT|nr:hypothetical protein [Flavihumibacter stibioxidans]
MTDLTRRVAPDGWGELREDLADWVNGLIVHDFQELVRILYRIDVNENKLKFLLKEKVGEDAAQIIADLIIERQLQKIKTRQLFKQPPPEDEEEKW